MIYECENGEKGNLVSKCHEPNTNLSAINSIQHGYDTTNGKYRWECMHFILSDLKTPNYSFENLSDKHDGFTLPDIAEAISAERIIACVYACAGVADSMLDQMRIAGVNFLDLLEFADNNRIKLSELKDLPELLKKQAL
jgi:hypothetical protein